MRRQHCTNFPSLAQENSQANFEQKDKIVRNTNKLSFSMVIAFKTLSQNIFPVFLKTNWKNAHDIQQALANRYCYKFVRSNWLDYPKSIGMKLKNSELHSIFFSL